MRGVRELRELRACFFSAFPNRCAQNACDKHVQENGRIQHRHPMYSAGGHQAHRLVVITEADGTLVVTQFDRDNDL